MSKDNNGGPAFPAKIGNCYYYGMTLRDYFAAHAPDVPSDFEWANTETDSWQRMTRWRYHYADCMLKARNGEL